jgi:hypothetical protein
MVELAIVSSAKNSLLLIFFMEKLGKFQFYDKDYFALFSSVPIDGFNHESQIAFVGDRRFLVKEKTKLAFFHFDLETLKLDKLGSIGIRTNTRALIENAQIVLDQTDSRKFVIYDRIRRLYVGKIIDNRIDIAFGSAVDALKFTKLVGKQFYGLLMINSIWQYCVLDLTTNALTSIEIPTVFKDGGNFELNVS